jgi:hypothetical protein
MKRTLLLLLMMVMGACGGDDPTPDDGELPTIIPRSAATATAPVASPTASATPAEAATTVPTETPFTIVPETSVPSRTPTPSTTPIALENTLDITITERAFQAAVNAAIPQTPSLERANIDFVSGEDAGIQIQLTAPGGRALVTGDVFIRFQISGGLVLVSVGAIEVASGEPPEQYTQAVRDELYPLVTDVFGEAITAQVGEVSDLQSIVFADNVIEITLLVP